MAARDSRDDERYRYRVNREAWRSKAAKDLKSDRPEFAEVLDDLDEYVAHITFDLSGQENGATEGDDYVVFLLASFIRTHMIATDLARGGDLTDSAVLVRKQMETLARLGELRSGLDISALIRRTPNVGHLRSNLKKLYGVYSEIAHSSDPIHAKLFGSAEVGPLLPIYPKYTDHCLVLIGHLAMTVVELFVWISENLEDLGFSFDREWATAWWASTAPTLADAIEGTLGIDLN